VKYYKDIVNSENRPVKIMLKILVALFLLILIVLIYGLFFDSKAYNESRGLVRENSSLKQTNAELETENAELSETVTELEKENEKLKTQVEEYEKQQEENDSWWLW